MSKFIHQGSDKKNYVREMFNDISGRYDLFNLISSFGIDRYWRYRLISKFNLNSSDKLIDIATGTGDVVFGIHKKFNNVLIGLDIADKMIKLADKKKEKKGLLDSDISFIQGDAEDLGFADNSFDGLTIAFGFRNFTDHNSSLKNIFRILKPGGKIVILELCLPENEYMNKIFQKYTFNVIPQLGKIIVNDYDSYNYLAESIKMHPHPNKVLEMMKKNNFIKTKFIRLNGGIVTIHIGYKN